MDMAQEIQSPQEYSFNDISIQLMKAFRGKQNQIPFSKALGFTFNQAAKWENREKRIMLKDVILVATHKEIPIESILSSFFNHEVDFAKTHELIEKMRGSRSTSEFAKLIGENRLRVMRWATGTNDIPFSIFLRMIAAGYGKPEVLIAQLWPTN
jgi:hypothetical protein